MMRGFLALLATQLQRKAEPLKTNFRTPCRAHLKGAKEQQAKTRRGS